MAARQEDGDGGRKQHALDVRGGTLVSENNLLSDQAGERQSTNKAERLVDEVLRDRGDRVRWRLKVKFR